MFANCYNPSMFNGAGLGDKLTDAGILVPQGRASEYWGKVKLRKSKIGVSEVIDTPFFRVPNLVLERFNLRSIEFGNWVNEQERAEMLYGSAHGFNDLSKVLNVENRAIGLNGLLGLALGARGRGGGAKAHYEPVPYSIINLTRTKGADSLAHEYGHSIDNIAGYYTDSGVYCSAGLYQLVMGDNRTRPDKEAQGLLYDVFLALFYDSNNKPTDLNKKLRKQKHLGDYYRESEEIFARTFETWISWKLKEVFEVENLFLTKELSYFESKPNIYPGKEDLQRADSAIIAFLEFIFNLVKQAEPATEQIGKYDTGSIKTAVQTTDAELPAEYRIVELDDLLTSHNPKNFSANPKYPAKCQQRDYTNDKAEQYKVVNGAKNFKPEFVINTVPTATDGTPIVSEHITDSGRIIKYVVLGGNGRTMMIKTLALVGRFTNYTDYLYKNCHLFGYDKQYIEDNFQQPVLVRLIEAEPEQCAYYSNVLNKGFTQATDTTTEAVSLARQITPEVTDEMAEIMEQSGAETLAQVWSNVKAQRAVISLMKRARIITNQNTNQFLDRNGDLDDKGKLIIERIFLAAILEDANTIEAARNYTAQILRVAPLMLQMKTLPAEWNLIPTIREAITLEYERRAANMPKADFVKQTTFDRPEGITGKVVTVWDMLDAGTRKFSAFVQSYVTAANNNNNQNEAFSFHEPANPDDLLNRFANRAKTEEPLFGDEIQTFSAKDIRAVRYRPIALPELEPLLGDNVPPNFDMVIWGDKFQGKSSLTMILADDLSLNGRVLLNQAEENPNSESFRLRLEKTNTMLRNVDVVHIPLFADLVKHIERNNYQFLIIDSLQRMAQTSPEKEILQWFLKNQGKMGMVFIARKDKWKRTSAGKMDWVYDVNIEVEVTGGTAVVHKNRYDDPREIKKRKYKIW